MSEDRAVLAGAGERRHMAELGRLATTLGIEVSGVLEQGRRDGTGYLGRGKREELRELVEDVGARFVIADDELTASQARVLEKACGVSVVDRTELSLLGGGGVTTRGPGEQQLEYDRRVIRERMATINRKLDEEKAGRAVRSTRLREEGPPTVTLVGYTNAGKTTILNALSGARRSTKDRLFETLETTTRRVEGSTKNGPDDMWPDFVVTDTVGFIMKLPTHLFHSFASTLEVARDADVTVVCADASSEELGEEIQTVTRTLSGAVENGAGSGPIIMCINKMDLVSEERGAELRRDHPHAVTISAIEDCEPLIEEIYRAIASRRERIRVFIPHAEYAAASRLYGLAEIHAQENTDSGLWMDVSLPRSASGKYAPYRV